VLEQHVYEPRSPGNAHGNEKIRLGLGILSIDERGLEDFQMVQVKMAHHGLRQVPAQKARRILSLAEKMLE